MAGFNGKAQGKRTTNLNGHAAYSMGRREDLAIRVMTSFMNEPKYYGDNTDETIRLAQAVARTDGLFVAKLAVYARTVMNMRSTSHMLCAVLAHEVKGEGYVRKAITKAVTRGDDATEILSAYKAIYEGEPLPNSLRRAIRDAIEAMDDHTIAKYQGVGRSLTMADAIKICHPKAREVLAACVDERLPFPKSWETEVSAGGNTKEVWEALIAEDRVPYMAMLRNLRNIVAAAPSNLDKVVAKIADGDAVRRSRQLPFRFWSAYKAVQGVASSKVLDALEDAIDASVANYPRLGGRTVIAVDTSGSMRRGLSSNGSVTYADVAALLGLCAARLSDDCWVFTFDDDARRVPVSARAGILSQMPKLQGHGGATNMRSVFDRIVAEGIDCDRVIILSDNEVNRDYSGWYSWAPGQAPLSGRKCVQSCADAYRRHVGHDVWVHAADMAGYGTCQFDGAKTDIIGGWSEKILNLIPMAEAGVSSLIDDIMSVRLDGGAEAAA